MLPVFISRGTRIPSHTFYLDIWILMALVKHFSNECVLCSKGSLMQYSYTKYVSNISGKKSERRVKSKLRPDF